MGLWPLWPRKNDKDILVSILNMRANVVFARETHCVRDIDRSGPKLGYVRLSGNSAQTQSKPTGTLLKRLLTTIVGVSYFLIMCFWGAVPFCVGVTIVAALGIFEFLGAYSGKTRQHPPTGPVPPRSGPEWINQGVAWLGLLFPLSALQLTRTQNPGILVYACFMAFLVTLFAWRVLRAVRTGSALGRRRIIYGVIGCLYVGLLFSSFVLLRGIPGQIAVRPFGIADRGAWLMLYAAMCVWATDTFAYFVGRTFGRAPLAPTLSPGKTVEGAIGGLIGAVLVGVLFGLWIHVPWYHSLIVGIIAGLAGQIGDLFESALKREAGIKDFGRIMPGHGGILDRADSLLFVIPLAFLYLRLVAGL